MGEKQAPAEKDPPLSSQVLEYYRNYSQSHQLPRYLCGEVPNTFGITERASEQIEIGDNISTAIMTSRPPLIGQDHTITNIVPPTVIITDADNRGQVSPTSSITSNRKLEWDNGADIGYENCEVANRSLFKSSSLPALNTLERNIQKDFLRHSPDGRIAETPPKNIAGKLSDNAATKLSDNLTSSSSTTTNDNPNLRTTTSDQSFSVAEHSKPRTKVLTSSSSSSESRNSNIDVANVIYVPVLVHSPPLAESTPNILSEKPSTSDNYYETPVILQPRKPPRKNPIFVKPKGSEKSKSTSFDNLQSLKKLDDTLEQRNQYFQKYLTQKQQKLCITKPSSAEYINKSHRDDNISIAIQTENVQHNRELIYLDHYVSDKEDSSSTDNSSKIVDCNSFEYLYGSAIDQEEKSPGLEDDIQADPTQVGSTAVPPSNNHNFISNKLSHSKAKSNLTNVTSTETNSSETKSIKLSCKLSNNLISDVEKSVDLLTRLLHSKKYDENAKKYYIRKIVRKIVDTKYVDDRPSSTSNSTHTDKNTNESNTREVPEKYQTQSKIEPPLVSEERLIKSETNLQDVGDIYPRLQRNRRFTLTNNEFFVGQNKGDDNDNTSSDLFRPHSRHVFPSYTTESSIEKMQDTNRTSACNSWKDDKTASERLMESQKYESDELVGFAQRERQSQLNWISNEINHLSKLKSLLENREFKADPTESTAVYMITTDKNNRGSSSRQSCNCHNRMNVPNVVSTSKTPGHHHIKLQRCSHNQQEYRVRQLDCDDNSSTHHRGHASTCPCQQQYNRYCRRTHPTSTSAVPTSSEETYKEQTDGPQQQLIENAACTSTGVTCTLLPSREAIISSINQQNICEIPRNNQGASAGSKQAVILPKSPSVPRSFSSSQKSRPAKQQVQSEFSNRNIATFCASKKSIEDHSDKAAKLISSEVYQSLECPTTAVRRYVFEIPIVDSHASNIKKSSNIGVNKTPLDLGRVEQVDFEVRNVHVKEDNNKEAEENLTPGRTSPRKMSFEDEIKLLRVISGSDNQSKSVSGKVLSKNRVASFEIGPSISRELIPNSPNRLSSMGGSASNKSPNDSSTTRSSSTDQRSVLTANSAGSKKRERSKITQTDEVRLKDDEIKRKVSEKSDQLDKEETIKKSRGSQTISLENYMKKLIAETMESNNWIQQKSGSDQSKISKNIVKQDIEERLKNGPRKSDGSSRKNSDQSKTSTSKESFDLEKVKEQEKSESSSMKLSNQIKTTTDSDKESFIDRDISASHKKSDAPKKKSLQKVSSKHPESATSDEYQRSFKHIRGASNNREFHGYNSDPDRFKQADKRPTDQKNVNNSNASSAVFVPRGFSGLKKEDILGDRPVERHQKQNSSVANARDSKDEDRPDSRRNSLEMGPAPLKEDSNHMVAEKEKRRSDHSKNEIVKSMPRERNDSVSNSSESKTTSEFSRNSVSLNGTTDICKCCRSNNISSGNIYEQTIHHHPLCQTCYQINQNSLSINRQPHYTFPNHICNCYTLLKTQQIQAIKTTINQLQSLDCNQPIECICPPHRKLPQQDNKCLNCNCPVKPARKHHHHHHHHHHDSNKTKKSPTNGHKNSGISYTLKLETATEDDNTEDKSEDKALGRYEEEVVVKVPIKGGFVARRGFLDTGKTEDSLEERGDEEVEGEEKENDDVKTKKAPKKHRRKTKSLQEYLSSNRPTFIESAEQRRRCLIELAYMREERCQKYKQLLAMTNGVPMMPNGQYPDNKGLTIQKPRIFSTKEMKRLTAKNYKKLPEVQQRKLDYKERQLKKANRLLSDIFNKKLRDKVLKGQPSLSTSISVINLM